jgi:hypothetical protein
MAIRRVFFYLKQDQLVFQQSAAAWYFVITHGGAAILWLFASGDARLVRDRLGAGSRRGRTRPGALARSGFYSQARQHPDFHNERSGYHSQQNGNFNEHPHA